MGPAEQKNDLNVGAMKLSRFTHVAFMFSQRKWLRIDRFGRTTVMKKAAFIFSLAILLGFPAADAFAKKSAAMAAPGGFAVLVRGFWSGTGSATVNAGSVQINATVTDDAGNTGTMIALDLPVVDGHFSGTGTVFGKVMTVQGRIEQPDPAPPSGKGKAKGKDSDDTESIVTGVRLGATFIAGGHAGRIAGSSAP